MMPYVQLGLASEKWYFCAFLDASHFINSILQASKANQYGYKIEIAEPNNPWSKDPVQCVQRNVHGLDLEKIQKQKAKWEKTTVNKLISMANNKNGSQNISQNCPKKKSPANTTAKLPETKNDTAKIQPKQNSSKKSQNEHRRVFRIPLLSQDPRFVSKNLS